MTRGFKALAAVAVVAALVVFAFQAVSPDDSSPPSRGVRAATRRSADARRGASEGMYVVSDVLADGQVKVQTWVRAPQPITRLRMTTTDPDLLPGSVESLGLVVRTMDGRCSPTAPASAPTTRRSGSARPPGAVVQLHRRRRLDDATSTVPGRKLPGCWGWTSTTRAPPAASYAGV
jgi:hypothetical protein